MTFNGMEMTGDNPNRGRHTTRPRRKMRSRETLNMLRGWVPYNEFMVMRNIAQRICKHSGYTFKYYINTETGEVSEAYQIMFEDDREWQE